MYPNLTLSKQARYKKKMENINQISNENTINLKHLKQNKPLSYAFYCLGNNLNNSGMTLIFIKQDKNRVYFKIRNNINNKTTYIMDLSNKDLLNGDYSYLLNSVWNN